MMTPENCPNCDRKVTVLPSYGGFKNSGQTAYIVSCECGLVVDHLGAGTMRSGIAAWNKYVQERRGGDSR